MKSTLILLALLLPLALQGQNRHSLRLIENDEYQTPLYGAGVYFADLNRGAVSNLTGHVDLRSFPDGEHRVKITFLGYQALEQVITLPLSQDITIVMTPEARKLEDVLVEESAYHSIQMEQAPLSTINISEMNRINVPRLLGEPDLIRMIQNLPGVKTETDFTGGFFVRGGRNDQNLILLDGVPVYNPWHLFGLFSAFNTEAIDRVELTKGIFPAQYGSRLSSVLDIELQKGDTRNGAGYLTISPLSASFSYGRPLNQKTSYLLSARRTYLDPIFRITDGIISTENDEFKNNYNFMDLNLKVVHRFNEQSRLETGIFYGNDVLKSHNKLTDNKENIPSDLQRIENNDLRYGWRNTTGSIKWIREKKSLRSVSHLFTSFYQSDNKYSYDYLNDPYRYESEAAFTTEEYFNQKFTQQFLDIGLQQDFKYQLNEHIDLMTGAQWLIHRFEEQNRFEESRQGFEGNQEDFYNRTAPAATLIMSSSKGDTATSYSHELSTYLSAGIHFGPLSVYPGLRFHYFDQGNYSHLLPRINLSYRAGKKLLLTAGYGHFSQYLQALSLDLMRIPAERWFWSDEDRPPALCRTYTAGVGYDMNDWGRLSLEGYYKAQTGLLNFSPEQQVSALEDGFIPQFSQETISGTGEAYGVEWMWNKTKGKITGWLGYTLSWAYNSFEEINDGQAFPSRVDKRHDIQTFWNWDFAKNWSLGLLFNYKTGQPITFTTGHYLYNSDPLGIDADAGSSQVILERNAYRLPAYHRLDLNLTWHHRKIFKHDSEISLNVINVYNHMNVLTVSGKTSIEGLPNGTFRIQPKNTYMNQLPIMPVISFRIGLGKDHLWTK